MEAKELRIGNWVYLSSHKKDIGEVHLGFNNTNLDLFEPIPLTKEWLIKFGAKEYGSFGNYKQMIIEGENELLICRIFDKGIALFCLDRCHREELRFINKCEFIHRFQNIAFELGEELTIKEK